MSNLTPLITLNNVSVNYRENRRLLSRGESFLALKGVNVDIYKGESIGVIGRNGAGKSTFLRLLSGVIEPDTGEIINRAKTTTLLALSLGFDEFLTGRRNTVMCGMLMGLSRVEIEGQVDSVEKFADIGVFFDRPVKVYSTGMRSRLAFAIANVVDADLLLIDEILAVGDADFAKKSQAAMELKILGGTTCVLISHQTDAIRRLCSKVLWIERGEVVMHGDVDVVLSAYES